MVPSERLKFTDARFVPSSGCRLTLQPAKRDGGLAGDSNSESDRRTLACRDPQRKVDVLLSIAAGSRIIVHLLLDRRFSGRRGHEIV